MGEWGYCFRSSRKKRMVHSMIRRVIPALSSFVFILYCGDRDALVGVFSLFVVREDFFLEDLKAPRTT